MLTIKVVRARTRTATFFKLTNSLCPFSVFGAAGPLYWLRFIPQMSDEEGKRNNMECEYLESVFF